MAQIMGYSVEDLVALPILDIFKPEDLPVVRERTERVRAGHRVYFTQDLRRADGSTFLAEVNTTPLFNQAGRYEGAVALVSDVTARNEAATQSRLRASLLDSIGEAVTAATPEGTLLYINSAAERLLGWRAAEVVGRNGRALFTAPEAVDDSDRIHNSLVKGNPYTGTLMLSRRDGSQFLSHLTSGPVLDEHGNLVGLVSVLSDQSERDQLDRDLERRELQAETLALLGVQALRRRLDPRAAAELILQETVDATRRLLHADQVTVLGVVPGGDQLRVNAASPQIDESLMVPSGSRSFAGYVALARRVVVVDNTKHDPRFDANDLPSVNKAATAIGAPIFGPADIVGVLTAERSAPNKFNRFDSHFIQGMANIVGTALLD
jgi:PAS domain S-box-containing protein